MVKFGRGCVVRECCWWPKCGVQKSLVISRQKVFPAKFDLLTICVQACLIIFTAWLKGSVVGDWAHAHTFTFREVIAEWPGILACDF
jgi:hypothetical protein